jgi:hypothetical protein
VGLDPRRTSSDSSPTRHSTNTKPGALRNWIQIGCDVPNHVPLLGRLRYASGESQEPGSESIRAVSREPAASQSSVEEEVETVAKSKQYLREVAPVRDPTALIPGTLHLSIAETPFILYLRPTNHHTEVRLESLKLDVSTEAIREANAFLRDVRSRSTSKRG